MNAHGVPSETSPARERVEICICCGRPLEPASTRLPGVVFYASTRTVVRSGGEVILTPILFRMFEELVHALPGGRTAPRLFDDIYGDRLDWDQPCAKTLAVQVSKLRRILRPLGLGITYATWAEYRLELLRGQP